MTPRTRRHRRATPQVERRPWRSAVWLVITGFFLVGLGVRVTGLDVERRVGENRFAQTSRWRPVEAQPLLEADERIYVALAEQLEAGRGYTLHGHPILEEPFIVGAQYDRPLFFHPPGGPALFWLMRSLVGDGGYALSEVVSFAVFYWSLVLIGYLTLQPFRNEAGALLAMLAAFTPIMAHVTGRLWIDGPLLGFATLACAVFLFGVRRRSLALVCAAGVILGAASWIKVTAFLAAPGAIALAWAITPREARRELVTAALVFLGLGLLVQLPWEVWQWRVLGTPFPGWAGRPDAELVRSNGYVRYLTVIRSPWIYVTMLPQVIWTLGPALILSALQWRDRELRSRALALVFWMAMVAGLHVGLGMLGYSKVLRYAILVTPAAVLLFAMAASSVFARGGYTAPHPGGRIVRVLLLVVALAGLGLELTQSLTTTFVDNANHDLIKPLTGFTDTLR